VTTLIPYADGNTDFEERCAGLPAKLVSKIGTIFPGSLNLLQTLNTFPSFRPHTISDGTPHEMLDWGSDSECSAMWSYLITMESITEFSCCEFRTRDFLLGFPPNLKTAYFSFVNLSGLDQQELAKVAKMLSSHQCRVHLYVYHGGDWCPPGPVSAAGWRRWAAETMMWAMFSNAHEPEAVRALAPKYVQILEFDIA